MASMPQPAVKSYFFGKGYKDLWNTIKGAWSRNIKSVSKYKDNISDLYAESTMKKVFLTALNIIAMIAVFVFGSAVTAALAVINAAVLIVFMLIIYVCFSLVWLADRIYLMQKKIFTACHECKEKSLIPTYLCPQCGVEHTKLTPGVYGILKRRCRCGCKLPTTFFNGRKELSAVCPHCGHPLSDRESRPICIPIVGGRSVGKTAFITAFSRDFIEKTAPEKGFEIQFYNNAKAGIYKQITSDYENGSTRMTDRPQDVNAASSVSFSFFVKHKKLSPDRLIHVYDIAGEVFTDNTENEIQKQYEYCQGIVLIIDPFAIPAVRARCEDLLSPKDKAGIGRAEIDGIIDSFLNKLREVTGLSDNRMSSVPLAVIISKTDSAGLDKELGADAVNALMQEQPERFTDYYNALDYVCRRFLAENDMSNFLQSVDMRFKNNRYFACSAIGHTRDQGEYEPSGVMEPMEWLISMADSKLGQLWNDTQFQKNTVKLEL